MGAVFALILLGQGVPIVTPLVGPPKVSWLGPPSDANGSGRGYDPHLEPLRLGLFDDTPPTTDPSCGEHVPENRYFNTTLRLVPRLTLAGFSRVGCARDGAAAAGLVYVVPIRKTVDLALSAGRIWAPHAGPNGTPIARSRLSADMIWKRDGGRSLSFGLGTTSAGVTGIRFGGVY